MSFIDEIENFGTPKKKESGLDSLIKKQAAANQDLDKIVDDLLSEGRQGFLRRNAELILEQIAKIMISQEGYAGDLDTYHYSISRYNVAVFDFNFDLFFNYLDESDPSLPSDEDERKAEIQKFRIQENARRNKIWDRVVKKAEESKTDIRYLKVAMGDYLKIEKKCDVERKFLKKIEHYMVKVSPKPLLADLINVMEPIAEDLGLEIQFCWFNGCLYNSWLYETGAAKVSPIDCLDLLEYDKWYEKNGCALREKDPDWPDRYAYVCEPLIAVRCKQ